MAKVKIQGHASGSGVLTVTAPNTSSDRTITLPDATGTLIADDGSGNVGIGVVPETWDSSYDALQIGGNGAVAATASQAAGGKTLLGQNVYVDSGSGVYEYISTDEASLIYQQNGEHKFRVAASGSADAAITWTDALIIKNDGRGLSQFTAKAWCQFNGTGTPGFADSHNCSSITDHGTGDYSVNFTNDLANANYSVVGSCGASTTNPSDKSVATVVVDAGAIRCEIYNITDAVHHDMNMVFIQVFGD